ncbi:MAG: ABC transporter ATP-binding protein [Phycisphaerales bacterium]
MSERNGSAGRSGRRAKGPARDGVAGGVGEVGGGVSDLNELLLVTAPTEAEQREAWLAAFDWSVTRRILGCMWKHARLQVWLIVWAVVLAVVGAASPLVVTETIRWSIERPEALRAATGLSAGQGVLIGGGVLLLIMGIFYVVSRARTITATRLGERVVLDLRERIFAHVQTLDMRFFDTTKAGRILSRGTSDVGALRHAVSAVIPQGVVSVVQIVALGGLMFWYDWVLALVLLGFAPAIWIANFAFKRRMGGAFRRVQETFSRMTANIAETVAGIRVTQAFVREDLNSRAFLGLTLLHRRNNMRAAWIHGLYIPLFEVTAQVLAVVIIGVGAWRMSVSDFAISELIGFLLLTGGVFSSTIMLAELYSVTLQAMAGGERIFQLLDTAPRIRDAADARPLERAGGAARVSFEGVGFGYSAERRVLHDVSFECAPGTTTALVGQTGSGKTTIVSLIARLYEIDGGEIRIDGRALRSITLRSLREQIGLVLQDNFLFSGTVRENIRFGRPGASDEEVRGACAALDCLEALESLPRGLETPVGERGASLSLGQRQLVCFARAMIADPRLVMLDEATSAIDTLTEHRLQRALERLMAGRTAIVVAHRLSTIRGADQILVMDQGRIVERGTHAALVGGSGHYARLHEEFVRQSAAHSGSSREG